MKNDANTYAKCERQVFSLRSLCYTGLSLHYPCYIRKILMAYRLFAAVGERYWLYLGLANLEPISIVLC